MRDDDLGMGDIRWHVSPCPPMDADEPLEFDGAALAGVDSALAPSLVATLKTIRRLINRLRAMAAVVRTMLAFIRAQQVEIKRLNQQVRRLLDERRKA